MGRKRIPGLKMRAGTWHIDKRIGGRRVCQGTGSVDLQEAERVLARVIEEARQAQFYGVRPSRTFDQAAGKFLVEYQHKRSILDDARRLKGIMPHIGHLPISQVHMGAVAPWIAQRRRDRVTVGTINHGLQIVRRILNLAASEWVDETGQTWLAHAPKIKLFPNTDKRKPYPLTWEEQDRLLAALPPHLADMALFAVNTGCRDGEICGLRWEWEVAVPELDTVVFIVPGQSVKNGDDRLVVLNRVARAVIERRRGLHPTHVFGFRGQPVRHMLNSAWKAARASIGLPHLRVHDLKHTFGRRLRAAGVGFEDRQDLLGHRSGRITTHYSAAELDRLIEVADRVSESRGERPQLLVLRGRVQRPHAKLTQASREPAGKPSQVLESIWLGDVDSNHD
jgi:integrase